MSLDYLQVGKNRTVVSAPGSELPGNDAVTSATQGVCLGLGLDVTNAGRIAIRGAQPYASSGAQSLIAGALSINPFSSYLRVGSAAGSAISNAELLPGEIDGQIAKILNQGSYNISFGASSNVANASGSTITANAHAEFVWSAYNRKWYKGA